MTHRSFLLVATAAALSAAIACGTTSSSSATDTDAGHDGGTTADGGDAGTTRTDGASTTTDAGNDAPSTASGCGITLQGTKWANACQSWLDQNCCSEEQACAGDVECKALVACMNACPSPPQDSCLNACSGDASATTINLFSAIGDCSKQAPPDGGADIPDNCAWPR